MHLPFHRSALNRSPLAARPRAWLAWLLVALVLAPALGLVHGVVHTHREHAPHGPVQTTRAAQADAHQAASWIEQLLPAHGNGDCRLYDQLAHADMAPGLAVLLPAVPVARLAVPAPATPDWVRPVARCRAREPPAVRI